MATVQDPPELFEDLAPPLTYVPERLIPVEDWLRSQARFAHLLRPDANGVVREIQRRVDADWAALRARCEQDAAVA